MKKDDVDYVVEALKKRDEILIRGKSSRQYNKCFDIMCKYARRVIDAGNERDGGVVRDVPLGLRAVFPKGDAVFRPQIKRLGNSCFIHRNYHFLIIHFIKNGFNTARAARSGSGLLSERGFCYNH